MLNNSDTSKYYGKRALLLTRVSTPEQEKMFGHTWQEMEIRRKLIVPLHLTLDEERHVIHDTYSGLEYRYREALERILEMAERGEFDVLCMEVLDRGLGRKALEGIPIRQIVKYLNKKHIPSPRGKGWNKTTISRMLHNTTYKGEEIAFATRALPKVRGRKTTPRVKTSPEDQVIVPVPRIIEDEQFEAVQVSLVRNKKNATRNLQHPYKGLLRSGLAKCAQCNGNVIVQIKPGRYKGKQGIDADEIRYQCGNYTGTVSKCKSCSIDARTLDADGWAEAVTIIRDPSKVDKLIQDLLADTTPNKQHRNKLAAIADIRNRQNALRKDLSELSQEGKLDKGTREYLRQELNSLAKQEEDVRIQLEDEQAVQEMYTKLHQGIVEFHKRCTQWRGKLDDPEFTPSYKFMREACEFFGITAIVYEADHKPRSEIKKGPPSIMSLISPDLSRLLPPGCLQELRRDYFRPKGGGVIAQTVL